MTSADRVTRARSLSTPDDAVRLYESWAADYDHDVFEVMGFTGTDRIADLLAAHVPDRGQPVIDLGCGTGAAGGVWLTTDSSASTGSTSRRPCWTSPPMSVCTGTFSPPI